MAAEGHRQQRLRRQRKDRTQRAEVTASRSRRCCVRVPYLNPSAPPRAPRRRLASLPTTRPRSGTVSAAPRAAARWARATPPTRTAPQRLAGGHKVLAAGVIRAISSARTDISAASAPASTSFGSQKAANVRGAHRPSAWGVRSSCAKAWMEASAYKRNTAKHQPPLAWAAAAVDSSHKEGAKSMSGA
eukprot:scaffold237485_cov24-Tisochrysis_lutea.AAC.2